MPLTVAPRPARPPRPLVVRELGPHDHGLVAGLFTSLSDRDRYLRFLQAMPSVSPALVAQLVERVDHRDHLALVALDGDRAAGLVRAVRLPSDPDEAEIAVTVAPDHRRNGLGRDLAVAVAERAASVGIRRLSCVMSPENRPAAGLVRSLGGRARFEDGLLVATLPVPVVLARAAGAVPDAA